MTQSNRNFKGKNKELNDMQKSSPDSVLGRTLLRAKSRTHQPPSHTLYTPQQPIFSDVWRQFVQSLLFRAENQVFHLTTISSQGSQCKLSAIEPLPVGEIHWLCERCSAHTTCATACHGARPWRACLLPRSISQHFAWIWHIVQTWAVVPNSKINNHVLGSQQLPNVSDALT